jgi:hypothetical protein
VQSLPHGQEFATAWNEWISYRKEIKKPMKSQRTIDGQLDKLSKVPERIAIDMIRQSITEGWTGIFPLKAVTRHTENTSHIDVGF